MENLRAHEVHVTRSNNAPFTIKVSRDPKHCTPNWELELAIVSFGGRSGLNVATDELIGFLSYELRGLVLVGARRLLRAYTMNAADGGVGFQPAIFTVVPVMLSPGESPVAITLGAYGYHMNLSTLGTDTRDTIARLYLDSVDPPAIISRGPLKL
jgi:hypothetical protein